jgi:DNA-binding NtrC family response regulator
MKQKILVIDDDREFSRKVVDALECNFKVTAGYGVADFRELFRPYYFDAVLLDMRLHEGKEGLDILKEIMKENPSLPVLIITGYSDIESAVEAMKLGAVDYIQKENTDVPMIVKMIESALRQSRLKARVEQLEKHLVEIDPIDIIGESDKVLELKEKIKIAAEDGDITVLITGESGTGKELVASNIHRLGRRGEGPFIPVLIAGLHKESIYSELFGHEKGSFTGAYTKRKGLLEDANKGVIFLDEIGDLDIGLQVKLLRVIESRAFTRLGGNTEISIDVQLVTATNRDLATMMVENRFREDLYYRLSAFEIHVPPLRERKEDIPTLAAFFLDNMLKKGRTVAEGFADEAIEVLCRHDWPGNVRELRNAVEYACIRTKSTNEKRIMPAHLPAGFSSDIAADMGNGDNIEIHLAKEELEFIRMGIEKYGPVKQLLAGKLGYPNRFTFTRRIDRIFERFPNLVDTFSDIAKLFNA